ncbi:hypothetical protein BHM03_00012838 [Ensete ventricosum]|nr:hypothetical protein BHM03_00012838 [Ensete ventricosum]
MVGPNGLHLRTSMIRVGGTTLGARGGSLRVEFRDWMIRVDETPAAGSHVNPRLKLCKGTKSFFCSVPARV